MTLKKKEKYKIIDTSVFCCRQNDYGKKCCFIVQVKIAPETKIEN